MDIRKLGFKTTMISFLVSAALMLSTCMVYAGDTCQLIRIRLDKAGGGSRVRIFPEKITVPVGTCTVWINFILDGNVQVTFRENAKQCILSTDAATGFKQLELETGEACYYSDPLPRGKTASLVWNTPGTYKYQLEGEGSASVEGYAGKMLATGVIEVK